MHLPSRDSSAIRSQRVDALLAHQSISREDQSWLSALQKGKRETSIVEMLRVKHDDRRVDEILSSIHHLVDSACEAMHRALLSADRPSEAVTSQAPNEHMLWADMAHQTELLVKAAQAVVIKKNRARKTHFSRKRHSAVACQTDAKTPCMSTLTRYRRVTCVENLAFEEIW